MQAQACIRELKSRRISPRWVVPPIFRLAWKMGINISPPFYWSELARVLFLGLPVTIMTFAVIVGLDAFVRHYMLDFSFYAGISAAAGMLSSIIFNLLIRVNRRGLNSMPAWEKLK